MSIHPTAVIDPSSVIAANVEIGPWCMIGPNVTIESGSRLGSHIVVQKNTTIGENNTIHPYASIGGDPQTKGYVGHETTLVIGSHNVIHEFCTINRGDIDGAGVTRIGDHNLLMTGVHVAHDCIIHNHVILVNHSTLGGHVTIHDHAVVSAFVAIHQFCTIGTSCFLTKGCMVTKDVIPYMTVTGEPPRVRGLNKVGLARRGFSAEDLSVIKEIYKILFMRDILIEEAQEALIELAKKSPIVQPALDLLQQSSRGIIR